MVTPDTDPLPLPTIRAAYRELPLTTLLFPLIAMVVLFIIAGRSELNVIVPSDALKLIV
jgi:hypothetical protein